MGNCHICKIVKILAGIGALNWGLVAILNLNLVTMILGDMTLATKIVYILIGLSGIVMLLTLFKPCPCNSTK